MSEIVARKFNAGPVQLAYIDEGDAKDADWNEESPMTAKPDELRTFEDRPELVVHVHGREEGPHLLEAAGTGLHQHRTEIRFARTKLEGVAALQRQTDLGLRQIRSEPLGVWVDMLEAWIVEPYVGVDALQTGIHGLKISVGILWLRESRRDLDRPVDMHLRSRAWREHLRRHALDRGSALDRSGGWSVWLRRLRTGDIRDAGHRCCHESRSACCR